MDPLSLTAGVINIVDSSRRTLQALSSSSSWQGERASLVQLETQICIQILDEMGQIALSYTSSIPESASLCLRLCQRHLQVLDKHLTDLKKAPRKLLPVTELEKTLKDFRRSVKLLRDIIMDSLTQHLVKEYRHAIRGINVGDMYINNSIDTTLDVEATKEHVRPVMDQLGKMLAEGVNCSTLYINNSFMDRIDLESNKPEEVLNQLRQAVRNVSNNADTMQSEPDPFEFQAKILSSDGDSSEPISICAKLDTQSGENWMSSQIVSRVGLENKIVRFEDDAPLYLGFGGGRFHPVGTVEIMWTRNSTKSWNTKFLVNSQAPFDMILGKKFIIDEGLFVFGEPVLATRLAPLSRDDYRRMEESIRERGAHNTELSMTREARDAAARQKRREKKAASRMSRSSTPGWRTPSARPPAPSVQLDSEDPGASISGTQSDLMASASVSPEELLQISPNPQLNQETS